jgi:hypothetical protein
MAKTSGRAYAFMRWSGGQPLPGVLGEIGWAFEYNDRLGRFHCFYCGSTESRPVGGAAPKRVFWFEKCLSLPELIKTMSVGSGERAGFEEVKVFEVGDAQSELALQILNQLAATPEEALRRTDPLEHTREILTRYGVRSIANTRGFNAPFLWYNMLPGRSVPLRKLAVHIFQLRAAQSAMQPVRSTDIEEQARRIAQNDPDVCGIGECVVCRAGTRFFIGLDIAVNARFTVGEGRAVAERIEQSIRDHATKVDHVFIRVEPYLRTD